MTSADRARLAIVGAAGRFPGAASLGDYWRLLVEGRVAAADPDASRGELWKLARDPHLGPRITTLRAGYLADVAAFDADYFRVSPREAVKLDPQQRLLMEVTHDALEDAGITRAELQRANVGVFIGASSFDYMTLDSGHKQHLDGYYGIGNSHNLLAGRLSYFLNLQGPSLAVDTACSSSLTALHVAAQSLHAGEIELAIVGGVNVIVSPDLTLAFSQAKMLSPSGRCRTFAADADGYGRAEAVGVIVLRSLPAAERARHPVRCVVAATAVNQDGRSNGIAAPNGQSQIRVVRAALDRAGVSPADLTYVEAHGTGTRLGDAIELGALQEVFAGVPCFVGSAKASIGHAEAAAGICGLLKAMLMLEHGVIPPHPVEPPYARSFDDRTLQIADRAVPIAAGLGRIGVSSFGFGGSNAHVVLEREVAGPAARPVAETGRPVLLVLSSHFAGGLAEDARALAAHLDASGGALEPVAATLMHGRDHLPHRRACVARSRAEAAAALREPHSPRAPRPAGEAPRVAFVFTGQGSQYAGMGRALYEAVAPFRAAFDRCDAAILACAGVSMARAVYAPGDGDDDGLLADTHTAQLSLFAFEYALASLWQALGVAPSFAIGHSIGELVAHTVAGSLTLEDGVALVHERGRLMQAVAQDGAMVSVSLDAGSAAALIRALAAPLHVAAVNARQRVVISGARAAIEQLTTRLAHDQVRFRALRTRHAFHSPMFDGAAAQLAERARRLAVGTGTIPVIGNLDGAVVPASALCGDYWGQQLARPVQFARGIETLVERGVQVFLEIGPDRTLSQLIAADHGARVRAIASVTRDGDSEEAMLRAAGALYELGIALDFAPLTGAAAPRGISLPARRLARTRYWTASGTSLSPSCPQVRTDMTTDLQHTDDVSRITAAIVREIAYSLKEAPDRIDPTLPFADMGADSLILLEALQEINARYRVSLTVLDIYEKVDTIAKVARYIHEHGGRAAPSGGAELAAASERPAVPGAPGDEAARQRVEQIVRQQLELMERQLQLLGKNHAPAPVDRAVAPAPVAMAPDRAPEIDRFSAFSAKLGKDAREDDADKRAYIQQLIARANAKTPASKRLAQRYRPVLADNRVSAGFRPLLKEMVYPILAEQAQGTRITDIDGNTYVDFTMGFGAHFFGHAPDFIQRAIQAQLARGMPIGPQSPVAGRVAELICELTGHARVTFCNSGTEATMTAVRLARARTGRPKVVMFRNSYHGTFDGFLARTTASSEASRPASLGTPDSMVADTVVLDYGAPSALDYIEQHRGELAAVLVEPVQSRAPSLVPAAFLRDLRRVTRDHDIALVFDEVITGFRCARGGAQELFGVRADLCAYGKILGGGMPIGVVAGSAAYMDGLDGGCWQYGDASVPATPTIFFAGTFSKHPLTLAASLAVLEHIRAAGEPLYRAMNERTERFCAELNTAFEAEGADVKAEGFASLFRFASRGNLDLFHYRVLDAGYFIWEGRNCFLSTAHTDEELRGFVAAVQQICRELVACRLLPARAAQATAPQARAISAAQQRFHALAQRSPDGAVACNLCFGLRFDAAVDAERLARAVASVVSAEDALWYRFDLARGTQLLPAAERHARVERLVQRLRVADRGAEPGALDRWMATEQQAPLDPEAGANLRAHLVTFDDGVTLLSLCVHHLVCDGWGLAVLFERIAARYGERPAEVHGDPVAHVPYTRWIEHEARYREGAQYATDRRFWHDAIDAIARYQRGRAFGPLRHRNTVGGRPGGRARLGIDARLTALFKAKAKADGVTPFTALFAGFQVFLNRAYRTRLPVVGIPFANRTTRELKQVIGTCVNLLPLLPIDDPHATFDAILGHTKHAVAAMFEHAMFPYPEICERYRAVTAEPDAAPVEVTFNVEPVSQLPRFEDCVPALVAAANHRIEVDLMWNVFVLDTDLRIELDYDTGRFAEDAVYGLLNLYAKIVENYANRAGGAPRSVALQGAA